MRGKLQNIQKLIRGIRRRQKLTWILAGISAAVAVALAAAAIAMAVEAVGWLEPQTRLTIAITSLVLMALPFAAVVIGGLVLLAAGHFPGDRKLASAIWERDEEVRDRILDALELADDNDPRTSESLRAAALEVFDRQAAKLRPESYVEKRLLRLALRFGGITTAIAALLFLFAGRSLTDAALRLAHPGTEYLKPGTVLLAMEMPDTVSVIQGDALELSVRANHHRPESVTFLLDEGAGAVRTVKAIPDSSDSSLFAARVDKVERNLNISALADGFSSDTVRAIVTPRPRIARLETTVKPPAYTGMDVFHLPEGIGDISALPGSRVTVKVEASRQLSEARLFLDDSKGKPRVVALKTTGREAEGTFTVRREGTWWLELTARDGVPGDEPLHWSIHLNEDEPPTIEVRLPDDGADIPENMTVPLVVLVDDDYGVSKTVLRFRIFNELLSPDSVGEEAYAAMPLDGVNDDIGRFVVQTLWSLANLPLLPTEEVRYFVEAWDNDGWRGPKRARSEERRLIFPSLDELYAKTSDEEFRAGDELEKSLDQAESLREKIEKTLERMKSNPEDLSWEETRALQQTMEKQNDLLDRLQQISQAIDQIQETFSRHDMVSSELLEKYRKLQELIEEVASPELREAMEKLQQALEQQDSDQVREALEQIAENQEAMLENIDRSIAILKQLQAERRLEELANKAEDLAQREKELSERLDNENDADLNNEAMRQEQIRKDFAALTKEMKDAVADMEQSQPETADSLAAAMEDAEQQQLESSLGETSQQLQSGQQKKAKKSSRKNQQKLENLANRVKKTQQRMAQQNKTKIAEMIDRVVEELLVVSRRQEELRTESAEIGVASPRYRELAAQQGGLLQSIGVVFEDAKELTKQTFFVGVKLLGELETTRQRMLGSIARYTDRRPRDVSSEQGQALAAIHRSIRDLNSAKNSLEASSSGTGYQEMMERLSQMAAQQQALNQASQGMPMPMPGGSMPGGDQLSQLAAQQRALAEAMRQLEQQSQSMEEILGSLDGLGNAMGEVADDLEERNISERTKRLQKRILQRLLDSQRSLQQREMSRERLSRTGNDIYRNSPGPLSREEENILRERMLRALEGDYARQWRSVIRDYYRALEKDTEQKNSPATASP